MILVQNISNKYFKEKDKMQEMPQKSSASQLKELGRDL